MLIVDEIPFFVTQFNNSSKRKITITEPLSHPCDQVPKRKRKKKFILVFDSGRPLIKVGKAWQELVTCLLGFSRTREQTPPTGIRDTFTTL